MSATLLYLSWICRSALAIVFALAVVAKTRDAVAFANFRLAARALTGVPGRRADVLAILAVAAEAAVAAAAIPPVTAPWAAAAAIVLLSLFTWRIGRAPGAAMACGCFGPAVTTRRAALIRNTLLLVVALLGLGGTLAATGSTGLAGALVCAAGAALLAAFVVRIDDITAVFAVRP